MVSEEELERRVDKIIGEPLDRVEDDEVEEQNNLFFKFQDAIEESKLLLPVAINVLKATLLVEARILAEKDEMSYL